MCYNGAAICLSDESVIVTPLLSYFDDFLPMESFPKQGSHTRSDLNLRYFRGALKSEQNPHTTWENREKGRFSHISEQITNHA